MAKFWTMLVHWLVTVLANGEVKIDTRVDHATQDIQARIALHTAAGDFHSDWMTVATLHDLAKLRPSAA